MNRNSSAWNSRQSVSRFAWCAGGLALLAACTRDATGPNPNAASSVRTDRGGVHDPGAASNVLYVLSNDPAPGRNAVLGYRRAADGTLAPLPGSPFRTGGTGVANPTQMLGPDDVDLPIAVSADHRRLFAVNPGSNTVAVFDVAADGALSPVPGSPFPSNGSNPVSVGLDGDKQLYVVNKAQDPAHPTAEPPNYTGFRITGVGALVPIPHSTVTTVPGASPQMALVSPSRRLLFGADFLAPFTPAHQGALRAFAIEPNGRLTPAPGTPQQIPGPADQRAVLGLWTHPTQNVLYVGFVQQNKLGVYTFDPSSGALTFQTTASNSGQAICWIVASGTGDALYTSNTGDNSVSWYGTANPLQPVERQHLVLREPGPLYAGPMGMLLPTSEAFQLTLDPAGSHLYIVSQHTNPDFSAPNGNKLHTLTVAADGSVSEMAAPLPLPVDTRTRPWGVVAF